MNMVHGPLRRPAATPRDGPCPATETGRGGAATCWNCDAGASAIVPVTVHAPAGGHATLRLCRACCASYVVPLGGAVWGLHPAPTRGGGRSQPPAWHVR
jgi:hypothetical protein